MCFTWISIKYAAGPLSKGTKQLAFVLSQSHIKTLARYKQPKQGAQGAWIVVRRSAV
jgi:hypothetical protein